MLRHWSMYHDTKYPTTRIVKRLPKQHSSFSHSMNNKRALLGVVAGHRLEALYRVALSLGLRRGEVLGLRWADVDCSGMTITITGALQRQGGRLRRTATK